MLFPTKLPKLECFILCMFIILLGYETDEDFQKLANEESSDNSPIDYDTQKCLISENSWTLRAKDLNSSVLPLTEQNGNRDNAHFLNNLKFVDYLIKDMGLFPLWSGVSLEEVGYGRNPASSAAVEGEFNIIKNIIFKNENLPIRADLVVAKHLDYLQGKMKIIDARLDDEEDLNNNLEAADVSNSSRLNDLSSLVHDGQESQVYDVPAERSSDSHPDEGSQVFGCPACASADFPSGAHKCTICENPVHALNECSKPYGEEGYGQRRICNACFSPSGPKKTIPQEEFSDRQNLGLKSGKRIKIIEQLILVKAKKGKKNCRAIHSGQTKTVITDKRIDAEMDCENGSLDNLQSFNISNTSTSNDLSICLQDGQESQIYDAHDKSNHCQPNKEAQVIACPACANADLPSGAHKCAICDNPVHALNECSKAYGEEGYGQKRICNKCFSSGSAKETLALREYDNWRNLGSQNNKIKKKSKKPTLGKVTKRKKNRQTIHLGQSKSLIKDLITWEKHKSIPVIKNGNSKDLNALTIEQKNISIENTCGFDAIFQLILIASHDYVNIAEKVHTLAEVDDFFKIVRDTKVHGLTSNTYRSRAKLLLKFNKPIRSRILPNLHILKCEINVASLARKLFTESPSFVETSTCRSGCPPRQKPLQVYGLMNFMLYESNAEKLIENHVMTRQNTTCPSPGCGDNETTELSVGDIVLFDIMIENTHVKYRLEDLPNHIDIPGNNKENLRLHGIIDFKGSTVSTRTGIGHYTAICYRTGNHSWYEYNDTHATTGKVSEKMLIKPAVAIFVKYQK